MSRSEASNHFSVTPLKSLQKSLLQWYLKNNRPLPWRNSKDPYKIWVSEVMLQQTTSVAVIPFYERFLKRFPTLRTLAEATIHDVYEMWAGLGYYSRARNLHKAAEILNQTGFPKTYLDLIQLPGFGPYTARAVSSIAFQEPVGVLDGNVIRVLSRIHGIKSDWWKPKEREKLQAISDQWVKSQPPDQMNQALMDFGSTICTPKNPACLLCPLKSNCVARKRNLVSQLPLPKPRRTKEIWVWNAELWCYKNKIAIVKNNYAPFLKGQNILPGRVIKKSKPPSKYDYKHNITHHEIYVKTNKVQVKSPRIIPIKNIEWYTQDQIQRFLPQSLITKALNLL